MMFGRRNCKENSSFRGTNWMQRECIAFHEARATVSRGDLEFVLGELNLSIFVAFMWRCQVGSGLFRE